MNFCIIYWKMKGGGEVISLLSIFGRYYHFYLSPWKINCYYTLFLDPKGNFGSVFWDSNFFSKTIFVPSEKGLEIINDIIINSPTVPVNDIAVHNQQSPNLSDRCVLQIHFHLSHQRNFTHYLLFLDPKLTLTWGQRFWNSEFLFQNHIYPNCSLV